ncbi:hypothetical protein NW765_003621 [Fusarium oxysporum]|nr:hypothetical protein NW765_003621 [Fusarium oxysporum]KAJ4283115.1 hypothetical protein NW764_002520 [Fusarium oxysporum]
MRAIPFIIPLREPSKLLAENSITYPTKLLFSIPSLVSEQNAPQSHYRRQPLAVKPSEHSADAESLCSSPYRTRPNIYKPQLGLVYRSVLEGIVMFLYSFVKS